MVVGDEVAAALRDLRLLDRDGERLVYRMAGSADGAVITTTADDLDELLGFVAAGANHEVDRRRRRRLDDAFLVLQGALDTLVEDEGEHLSAMGPATGIQGRWRIVEMELWDRDALDLVAPAHLDFATDGTGQFGFIAVQGWIDWRVDDSGRVEFSWDGVDEGDQVSGRRVGASRGERGAERADLLPPR